MTTCKECARTFKRPGDYANHVRTCGTSKLCTYCGTLFSTAGNARTHEKTCKCKEISKDVLEMRVKMLENSLAEVLRHAQRWETTRDRLREYKAKNRTLEKRVAELEYTVEKLERNNVRVPVSVVSVPVPVQTVETEERKLDIELDPVWIYRGIMKDPKQPWKKLLTEVMEDENADVQGNAVVCGYNDKYEIWHFASHILRNAAEFKPTFVSSPFESDGETRKHNPNTYAMIHHEKAWKKFVGCVRKNLTSMKCDVLDYMKRFR